jgi:hypothetical protein
MDLSGIDSTIMAPSRSGVKGGESSLNRDLLLNQFSDLLVNSVVETLEQLEVTSQKGIRSLMGSLRENIMNKIANDTKLSFKERACYKVYNYTIYWLIEPTLTLNLDDIMSLVIDKNQSSEPGSLNAYTDLFLSSLIEELEILKFSELVRRQFWQKLADAYKLNTDKKAIMDRIRNYLLAKLKSK